MVTLANVMSLFHLSCESERVALLFFFLVPSLVEEGKMASGINLFLLKFTLQFQCSLSCEPIWPTVPCI